VIFFEIFRLLKGPVLVLWGCSILWAHYGNLIPERETLKQISGRFEGFETEVVAKSYGQEASIIRIKGKNGRYLYPSWYPKVDEVLSGLNAGDWIDVLSDVGDRYFVWELRQNGETVIDYALIRAVFDRERGSVPWHGSAFLLAGAVMGGQRLRKWLTPVPEIV
jgi:hypothetical protein